MTESDVLRSALAVALGNDGPARGLIAEPWRGCAEPSHGGTTAGGWPDGDLDRLKSTLSSRSACLLERQQRIRERSLGKRPRELNTPPPTTSRSKPKRASGPLTVELAIASAAL